MQACMQCTLLKCVHTTLLFSTGLRVVHLLQGSFRVQKQTQALDETPKRYLKKNESNLCSADAVAADIDDIIHAAGYRVEAIGVSATAVPSEVIALLSTVAQVQTSQDHPAACKYPKVRCTKQC